ncbi:MAG: type I secretion system permease/ATPase, partial [Planktomarina sp.]
MRRLLIRCFPGLTLLAVLSVVVALLQFVVPLYMMAVYNRILQTRSMETLQLISIIAVTLLIVMGICEIGRSRVLALMSKRISSYLNHDVYQAILASPGSELSKRIDAAPTAARTESLSDLRNVSQFISNGALNTFFDAILAPIFLVALFILHPLLGWIGIAAAVVIFGLAIIGELIARRAMKEINNSEGQAHAMLEQSLGQFDAVTAMGMAPPLYSKWQMSRTNGEVLAARTQTTIGVLSGLAKAVRLVVQMGVLGVGAYLVMTTNSFLAGAIIASSIILGRALAPIDQSIGLWRPFVAARQAAARLVKVMDAVDADTLPFDVPVPKADLTLDGVTILIPGQSQPLVNSLNLRLGGGAALGVFGMNGMGKTTVLRAITGLLAPTRGTIALGGVSVTGMSADDRSKYFGYLPQDVQLLPGTIAENIARFREPDKDMLFRAAEESGAMEFIKTLPMGLQTPLALGVLSAGQIQLIGLARAIYGDPVLLTLDEPTANLDAQGRVRVMKLITDRMTKGL